VIEADESDHRGGEALELAEHRRDLVEAVT
jgi:hypothetical protein